MAIALEENLTILGTSDIHGLIAWDYIEAGRHRPVTLVFAEERSPESPKEALFKGQTVAVYNGLMVGREAWLLPLLTASVEVTDSQYIPDTQILKIELRNTTSSDLLLENAMDYTFYSSSPVFELPAGGSTTLQIKTLEVLEEFTLELRALGAYTAPKQHPVVRWKIQPE